MLEFLGKRLANAPSIDEKITLLAALPCVDEFLLKRPKLKSLLLSNESKLVLQEIIAIGQADRLLYGAEDEQSIQELLARLIPVDHFYRELGGIVGYQSKILDLLKGGKSETISNDGYHSPAFLDISEETASVKEAVDWGIEALPLMAEIYPLGGAADRLHLVDEATGVELPAAKLPFAGRTLLEHLIRDLEAREFLYFQTYGHQVTTPIAIMTSQDKNNHFHVLQIFEKCNYFGRPKESIRFFTQPLVPAVNENGDWCLTGPLKPLLKPGGHGAIWKLARDEGIFDWLESLGKKKALVRQINNPIAGLDYGLLAFTGIGCRKDMVFGFASCPRLLQAAEGVNVLVERGEQVVLTNIEYCDFAKFGIEDLPLKEGEPYSRFSSNTNILFVDLKALSDAVDTCPFPGLLMNLKKASYTTELGEKREEMMARLESTMQNIADVFVEKRGEELKTEKTFVTYNRRHKTISTSKRAFVPGKSIQETPENCFYDLLLAHRELLLACGFSLPQKRTLDEYLQKGPEFLFLYHPTLGPLYSILRAKMKGGELALGSELLLEIADLSVNHLKLQGSLRILAEHPTGVVAENGLLHFSNQTSRCILENVVIENQGVDWNSSQPFWKMDLRREESVTIILKGKCSFSARNIRLKGTHTFIVEEGQTIEL
jgi:hypothetical protein